MKLTRQQGLILFDIAKSAMNHSNNGFAGYSKEDLMGLLNDIISQQDTEYLELEDTSKPEVTDATFDKKNEKLHKKISKDSEEFWD